MATIITSLITVFLRLFKSASIYKVPHMFHAYSTVETLAIPLKCSNPTLNAPFINVDSSFTAGN